MMTIFPDPEESNIRDSIGMIILWVIAFFMLFFTLPSGCKSDDQVQQYHPYYDPPSKRPESKIKQPIQDAAKRVDKVLEKTPVPAVTEIVVEEVLDTIEQIKPLPEPTAPDPEVVAIIEPEPDPFFTEPENYEELEVDEPNSGLGYWLVICTGILALIYVSFKMLKGMKEDVKDSES